MHFNFCFCFFMCECKELNDRGSCINDYILNSGTCDCECNEAYKIAEYLYIKNCLCEKSLFDKLVLTLYKKSHEKSYKNIIIDHIRYITIKNLSYVKINSANPLYIITDKLNGTIEENNINNKYLTLGPTDERKEIMKKIQRIVE